jgi:hypothetical protein
MEMMDLNAATQLLNSYVVLLQNGRWLISENRGKPATDVDSQQLHKMRKDAFDQLCDKALTVYIAISEKLQLEVGLTVKHPEPLSELLRAQKLFQEEYSVAIKAASPVASEGARTPLTEDFERWRERRRIERSAEKQASGDSETS